MLKDGEVADATLSRDVVLKSATRFEGTYVHSAGDEVTTGDILTRR